MAEETLAPWKKTPTGCAVEFTWPFSMKLDFPKPHASHTWDPKGPDDCVQQMYHQNGISAIRGGVRATEPVMTRLGAPR